MTRTHPRNLTLAALTIAMLLSLSTLPGCIINSASGSNISGAYVKPSAVTQVKVNHSTTSDVEEIMGQPTTKVENDDATETWTWDWTKTEASHGTVLFIFSGASKDTISESVHVKFRDHIVIKKWRD